MLKIFVFILFTGVANCYENYLSLIPNGDKVKDPCTGLNWRPVGHYNPSHHTKDKNQFGLDFKINGFKWDRILCEKDSDRDGKTNGEELGDPLCQWTQMAGTTGQPTGHPGICEPVNSDACVYQAYNFGCGCYEKCNHGKKK